MQCGRSCAGGKSASATALDRARQVIALACAAPNLVEFQTDLASKAWPAGHGFAGPIEYLEIGHAAQLTEPPPLGHPEALRTLRIYNARNLDLGALPEAVDLEWLEIFRTKVLRGAATIARMRRLRKLNLESVASIPGADILRAVTAREVNVRHSDGAAATALKR